MPSSSSNDFTSNAYALTHIEIDFRDRTDSLNNNSLLWYTPPHLVTVTRSCYFRHQIMETEIMERYGSIFPGDCSGSLLPLCQD